MASPKETEGGDIKAAFEANTRAMHLQCLAYQASIHLAWEAEPNHERISSQSQCFMQCTRENLELLKNDIGFEPKASVVTLILDVITDKKHFHFVRETKESAKLYDEALASVIDDTDSYQAVSAEKVAALAAVLAAKKTKDMVPLAHIAACIGPFADRCQAAGKELHLFLTGCNTISLCLPLQQVLKKSEPLPLIPQSPHSPPQPYHSPY